jgi:6-phosphogluconate dehydrogenase
MQIGLIGLGKMGFNLALNIHGHGHEVMAFDLNSTALESIGKKGIKTASSVDTLTKGFAGKKVLWLMIPAGEAVDQTIKNLLPLLKAGDIVIDGGNSFYKDSVRRAKELDAKEIDYLDCGTSGGTEGALQGVCAMIGGTLLK